MPVYDARLHVIPKHLDDRLRIVAKHFGKNKSLLLKPELRKCVDENLHLLNEPDEDFQTKEINIKEVPVEILENFEAIARKKKQSTSQLMMPYIEDLVEQYRDIWESKIIAEENS